MIVISEASSHQTSISKSPNAAASEVPNATMIARLMRVIMPGFVIRQFALSPADEKPDHHRRRPVFENGRISFEPGNEGAVYPNQR